MTKTEKSSVPLKVGSGEERITQGPLFSSILIFVIPIVLTNLVQTLFNAVDMVMVNFFSETGTEVASIGCTNPLLNLFKNLAMGISVGTSILLARYLGAKEEDKVKKTVSTSVLAALLIGVVIAGVSIAFMGAFLSMMHCPPECYEEAWLYSVVNMAGMPALLVYNYAAAILRVSGDSKRPLYYMLLSGGLNVLLNLVFCLILPSKILAVALATVLSQVIGAVMTLLRIFRMAGPCRLTVRELRMDWHYFLKILRYGLPSGLCSALFSVSNILIYSALNEYGAATMAGESAAAQLQTIILAIHNAYHVAAQTFIGQNIGAGKPERVKKSFWYCTMVQVGVSFVLGLLMNVFVEELLYPFVGTDPVAIYCGKLSTFYLAFFFFIYTTPLAATIQAFGYPTLQMSVNLLAVLGVRSLWMTVVYHGGLLSHSLQTIYLCYPISYVLMNAIYIPITIYLFAKYKKGTLKKEL
ncbi:MAG: MATE family efflux transporter [Clostridia bacterium]|nr:MATE family efflux transporter [Clostridia bacterium]